MDYSLPGSSIHGIFQARVLEWVAISFFRGSSQPSNRTQVSRIAGRCLYGLSHQASYLASLRLLSIYSRRRWERLSGHRPLCLLLHWMMLRTVALKLYCTLKCLQCSEISPSSGCIADQLNQNACEWALSWQSRGWDSALCFPSRRRRFDPW